MFHVFDELLHTGKPDLGLKPIKTIYGSEYQWTQEDIDNGPTPQRLDHIRNLGTQYKGQTVCHDVELWHLDPQQPDHYLAVTEAFNETFGTGQVGHYGYGPHRDYWNAINGEGDPGYISWQERNDELIPVMEKVTALFPCLYTFYDDEDGWLKFAEENIKEARRISSNPVYPFLWFEYHDGGPLNGQKIPRPYWRKQLEFCFENCEGLVIWGGWQQQWDDQAPWWLETQDFMESIMDGEHTHPDLQTQIDQATTRLDAIDQTLLAFNARLEELGDPTLKAWWNFVE